MNVRNLLPNRQLTVIILLSVFWGGLFLLNPFSGLHSQVQDVLLRGSQPSDNITLVEIDDESLNEIGQWPWPREEFATFLGAVQPASVVGIDVNFNESSRYGQEDDQALATAVSSPSVPVVLPSKLDGSEFITPLDQFENRARIGFSNMLVGNDGAVRQALYQRQGMPSFDYALLQTYASTTATQATESVLPDEIPQPFRVAFRGSAGTYPAVSFADVVSGEAPEQLIEDKILIVGVTASSLTSFFNTPFGLMSGPEVHANILDTLLSEDFYTSSQAMNLLLVLILSIVGSVAALQARRMTWLVFQVVGAAVVYISVAVLLVEFNVLVDVLYPPLAVVGSASVMSAYEYVVIARREGALRRSYNTLNTLLESMTEGVVMLSHDQEVVVSNPVARKAVHANNDPVTFSDLAEVFADEFDLQEVFADVIDNKQGQSFRDIKLNNIYYQIVIAPVAPDGTEMLSRMGAVVVFHDMTEQKEIERIREDFTSMMVHELRSPLDAVRKMADFLNDRDDVDEDKKEKYLSLMSKNSSQVLTLVNDLLDVSKIEAGKFQLNKEPADVTELAEDQVDFYEQLAEDRDLSFSVSEDVPGEVLLDPDRIKQVMNNLLSNAIKFTDEQEGEITVQARYHESDISEVTSEVADIHWFADDDDRKTLTKQQFITIEIRDNGAGMSQENITELFDKFKQFEAAAKSEKAGTGLGMAIVKGITEEHGGRIGVASKQGEGTHFFIALPANNQSE